MISLKRDRGLIDPSFTDPDRQQNLLELFTAARAGTLDDKAVKKRLFSSSRWKKSKKQLSKETHGKCAFCETPTSAGYYGDVEHFRPKSVYWWLAYCYDNYLYSCRVCNGKKSDQHRLGGIRISEPNVSIAQDDPSLLALARSASPDPTDLVGVNSLERDSSAEDSHLPDPYTVNVDTLFAWEVSEVAREVRQVARNSGNDVSSTAAKAMEEIVDINREELLYWRWQTYESLADLKDVMDAITSAAGKQALRSALRKLVEPDKPYSAMSRYFLVEKWGLI